MGVFPDPIPGVIPFGTVTLLAGAPASGKTTLLADWIRRWRAGEPILNHPTQIPAACYYLAVDRSWASYAPIFADAGVIDLPHYSLIDDTTVSIADIRKPFEGGRLFDRALEALNPIPGAHVFVDPMSPIFITGDSNRTRDVAASMISFGRRCVELSINLTMTVHFSKQRADVKDRYARPQDRISGSGSFSGFSHTQIYLCDPDLPKQPYYTLGWNPRHAAPEEFKLIKGEGGKFTLYTEEHGDIARDRAVLAAFPPAGELIAFTDLKALVQVATGFSPATVKRALEALIRDRRVLRMGRGAYTQIKPS